MESWVGRNIREAKEKRERGESPWNQNQPDSSKREDSWENRSMTNSQYEQFVKESNKCKRCGTRNSRETD